MKKKLDTFKGKLTHAEIAEGMNIAAENAKRLAEDAEILFAASRYPSAAALAILSIEESGKKSILRGLASISTNEELIEAWKNYRSHTKKNKHWILPQLTVDGARKLDDLNPLVDPSSDHPYILDQLKQLSFYTDCLNGPKWSIPTDVISKEQAQSLVKTAKIFVLSSSTTLTREIELWALHIHSINSRPREELKESIINWYSAMQNEGLKPVGENKMEEFIKTGIKLRPV